MKASCPGLAARAPKIGALTLSLCLIACAFPDVATASDPAALVHPQQWPQVPQPATDDAAFEAQLEALMSKLTLEEKVGQIIQADIGSITPEEVRQFRPGALLNGGNIGPGGDDLAPPQAWLAAADAFYAASMDTSGGKQAVPIMWGTDAVHGHNNIIGATLFPHNIALGAARDPELVRRIGAITARELRVTGQDWTFAPTLAVAQDVRWGRTYESYSGNTEFLPAYAIAAIEGLQGSPGAADFMRGEHVIATAKHFIGDGGTFEGRDQGDARVSEAALRDIHAVGYQAAIGAGVQVVMASFSSWNGAKMHANAGLLTEVLKQRMGFKGFVVGDWNGHAQVPGCNSTQCAAAFNAGLDMFMAPGSWKKLYINTLAQVRSGAITQSRLDDAVRRILRVKFAAGLFDAGKPSTRALAGRFELLGAAEHRAVARQAVRASLVLLKNSAHLLPLRPDMKVLIAGDGANNISKQSGGWTLSWQGKGLSNADFPHAESIYSGIEAAVKRGGGTATLSPAGTYRNKPDVAIVVFGEDPYAEFRGDIKSLQYTQDLKLLQRLHAAKIALVAVFLTGRPRVVSPHLDLSDAFVAAWLPGSEGGGIADVLFAKPDGTIDHDFKGKLPFAWPATAQPGGTAQFAYGFGLTYQDGAGP